MGKKSRFSQARERTDSVIMTQSEPGLRGSGLLLSSSISRHSARALLIRNPLRSRHDPSQRACSGASQRLSRPNPHARGCRNCAETPCSVQFMLCRCLEDQAAARRRSLASRKPLGWSGHVPWADILPALLRGIGGCGHRAVRGARLLPRAQTEPL